MRLVGGTVYALSIPFVESFAHSRATRAWCDSVVVRVEDEVGTEGFGEGVPRPYVTGETVSGMLEHLAGELWPAVAEREWPPLAGESDLYVLDARIPHSNLPGVVSDSASRAALELAILDCVLRRQRQSLGTVLRPRRPRVVYSGVIPAGPLDRALQHARQMKLIGLRQIKVKVGGDDDVARVQQIREVVGHDVSLRVDANGAWSLPRAVEVLRALAPFAIAAVEQPLPRGPVADLRWLREASPVPIMVDESLVTLADAEVLIAARAADYFNIRVSKQGGLARSLEIARRAREVGIQVQVGSQVGETAILSAAGRHLAAALDEVAFVEGSYGSLLLTEDVSVDPIRFGHGGVAPILTGPGLGVRVLLERLQKYAERVIALTPTGVRV